MNLHATLHTQPARCRLGGWLTAAQESERQIREPWQQERPVVITVRKVLWCRESSGLTLEQLLQPAR